MAPPRTTGWQRCIRHFKLQVSFCKIATGYRALLRKITCKDKAPRGSSPHIYTHTHKHKHTHTHAYPHTALHKHSSATNSNAYTCAHTQLPTVTHIHTHTHTHTNAHPHTFSLTHSSATKSNAVNYNECAISSSYNTSRNSSFNDSNSSSRCTVRHFKYDT